MPATTFRGYEDTLRRSPTGSSGDLFTGEVRKIWIAPEHNFRDLFQRFLPANAGGATLLVLMILMSFYTSREACLIITSVWILGFATFVAVFTPASRDALIVATSGYTAMLVVFVGNALAQQHSKDD